MMLRTGRACIGALLITLAYSAFAGNCSPPSILVSAFDSNFEILSLRADDLSVEVGRKHAQILSLSLDTRPRQIVLMVDSSGSVGGVPNRRGWGAALPTAAYAVDTIPASASAALVTFSDKLERESIGFENPRVVGARVLDLNKRQPGGQTLLFDSIDQVLSGFKELHFGDAIYVVTDGGDNKSKTSLSRLREDLISRGIRVFVFLVLHEEFYGELRSEEEISGASRMQDLADSTGGVSTWISSADVAGSNRAQLDKSGARIANQVEKVYRVELGISPLKKAVPVKVSLVDHKQRRVNKTAYSHEIVPCSSLP